MATQATHVGTLIDGKYEIVQKHDEGGMSTIWRATDLGLKKTWAVKEMKQGNTPAITRRYHDAILDEANFIKKLDHPAIPRVVAIDDRGDTIFVVMDFVAGATLNDVLIQKHFEPFADSEVIDWGLQLCDVIGYLHSRTPKVVYRDLKPSNIILQSDTGVLKLIDFGIAIELDGDSTKEYNASGSYGYSAPEQLDPKVRTDTRADIYALGATLYTLATGNVPHRAEDGSTSIEFVFDGTMNEGLEHVIRRATNKNRERRYQSVDDLRDDLERNEQFTEEYRAVQQHKVAVFRHWLIAAATALVLGVVCLLSSRVLTSSTYDSNMHEASVASRDEIVNRDTSDGSSEVVSSSPSAAEQAFTRAIELRTGHIEPYEELIKVYKDDRVLSPGESERFTEIFARYGSYVNGDARYSRLNYDAGIMYLCYYDPLAYDSEDGGAGAVSNARHAATWFEAAKTAYDSGATEGMTEADRKAVDIYLTIADFYDEVSQSAYEGTSNVELHKTFWDALKQAVDSLGKEDEAAVRLRLYQVAYQAIASPAYLRGFYRAGIHDDEMYNMLDILEAQLADVSGEVDQNEKVLRPIYKEIKTGIPSARENVRSTYGNSVDGSKRADSKGGA